MKSSLKKFSKIKLSWEKFRANPDNKKLRNWLDDAINTFDNIYSGNRPKFLDGYKKLKDAIKPWGV